jgi:hypothetical protein
MGLNAFEELLALLILCSAVVKRASGREVMIDMWTVRVEQMKVSLLSELAFVQLCRQRTGFLPNGREVSIRVKRDKRSW